MGTAFPRGRVLRWAMVAVALLVTVAILNVFLRSRGVSVQVSPARRVDLLVRVQCDGALGSPRGGELRAAEAGTVAELLARDGEEVRQGQLLVRLSSPELESQAREARAAALRIESEEASAASELAKARMDVDHWGRVVSADHRLFAQAAITRSALEADELALNDAKTSERSLEARLASFRGERGLVRLVRAAAAELERRVAALAMRAPQSGHVYGLFAKTGEVVQVGQLVAGVVDPDRPTVRLRVDQPDLPRVAPGQRLVVTFSGLPDRRWDGRVVTAAPVVREVGEREVGEVVGELSDPEHMLPLNASVEAQIVIAEKVAALTVPRATLYRDGSRRFVYVLRDGRAQRRDVVVGLVGLSDVEITSGLAEGDPVLLAGTVPLLEGLRVAPAP